jgi:hypothetical protein
MTKQYKVTAPYITVSVAGGDGQVRLTGFYRDHILPPEVPEQQIKNHVAAGLIEEIEGPADAPKASEADKAATKAADDALTSAQRERDAKAASVLLFAKPERADPKATWVAYAVAITADTPAPLTEAEADAMSKAELVERFK